MEAQVVAHWLLPVNTRETWLVLTASAIVWIVLFARQPKLRRKLVRLAAWLLLSWLAMALSAPFNEGGMSRAASTADELGALGFGLVLIKLWILFAFKQLVPTIRPTSPRILEDIVLTLAFVAWGMARLRNAGLEVGQIVATSAVLTAVLAFAMQDTLGNILSGLALQWDRSIQTGDWVKVDDISGRVADMTWRATFIETRNGETVVIPNSQLTRNRFQRISRRSDGQRIWRRWVYFDVTLETLPTQIISLVEASLAEAGLANVATAPPPNCVLMSTEHGVGRFAVRYWLTDMLRDDPTDSLVRTAIDAALRRNGRRMSPPQHSVLLSIDNKRFSENRHKRHTEERLSVLRGLELLQSLTEDELITLAERLRFTPFVTGNVVLHQGDPVEWLYIVTHGEVELLVAGPDGTRRSLAKLGPGEFFGEIGLMTGEPFPLSAVACCNVECFRLDRESFHSLLLARTELAESFSQVLLRRLMQRQALLTRPDEGPPPAPKQSEVLARMRAFFGLNVGR